MALLDITAQAGPGARLMALLNNARFRSVLYQALTLGCVVLLFWYLVSNTIENMSQRDMSAGFDFLGVSAGFGIGFTLIPYREGDTYLRVFMVGIANTLLVAVVAIVLSTLLGLVVGLARLSSNWVIRNVARWYIEILRNTPLLLQIIAWYFGVFTLLPRPRDSVGWLDAVFLNNRGLYIPAPLVGSGFTVALVALLLGIAGAFAWTRFARREREQAGRIRPVIAPVLALLVVPPLLAALVAGAPLAWDMPQLRGFNFVGGINIPPSFCALIIALSIYTSCFIGENVRSGVQSVSRGQTEAARALGVPPGRTMRSIILPQALRVIIPPLISQYLNITKNSSLAIAIGFPDLVSVWMNTSLNQSGRAIPIVAMTMGFYCLVSLAVSLAMNRYNRAILIRER
ncbi:MAG: ABC transporter permease subunit [Bosea sp. (in: a-proteobacteria)]|uniref:amino acid ABC transporter permease n=1 Tax=Bosea sp. (in: a-proteobacteria) TaxID=1871050 RepID=UPI001DAAD844|nr:ABC transporter permease subunit [Bosea sp. (in: a-proteobacteria)]MBA4268538.1 amino acid ABC transporter permease [Methylobacterium sp.]MBX9873784.1 ABC transporter permease subunit [Beijerinckiaceae bacterium]MBA4334634.1 amino acid ABC transporter permease [Methylobacterium sp.]MCZ8043596.1 ABC transporter permease subunit [Beijerinckiaceae bacterium]MDP3600794.1 ABC transporter permease subunit [Bosea sp. (in: a-proteobacteria)]